MARSFISHLSTQGTASTPLKDREENLGQRAPELTALASDEQHTQRRTRRTLQPYQGTMLIFRNDVL